MEGIRKWGEGNYVERTAGKNRKAKDQMVPKLSPSPSVGNHQNLFDLIAYLLCKGKKKTFFSNEWMNKWGEGRMSSHLSSLVEQEKSLPLQQDKYN